MHRFVDEVSMIEFPQYTESSENTKNTGGYSCFVETEGEKSVPFAIRRIFYIYGANGEKPRGKHANRRSKFVLVSISGSCKVRVIDEYGAGTEYVLDEPNRGLYLPEMIWKEMYGFSPDCVLLVLSSEPYDAEEYIRDFDEYAKEAKEAQHIRND